MQFLVTRREDSKLEKGTEPDTRMKTRPNLIGKKYNKFPRISNFRIRQAIYSKVNSIKVKCYKKKNLQMNEGSYNILRFKLWKIYITKTHPTFGNSIYFLYSITMQVIRNCMFPLCINYYLFNYLTYLILWGCFVLLLLFPL